MTLTNWDGACSGPNGRNRVRVVDGLGREDRDLVAVDEDVLLPGDLSAGLEPDFDVGRAPDDLKLVLLQEQACLRIELGLADLEIIVTVQLAGLELRTLDVNYFSKLMTNRIELCCGSNCSSA